MISVEQFLDQNHIGILMRTFATKSEDIPTRVELVKRMLDRTQSFQIGSRQVFERTDILVWKDNRYNSDCGQTLEALKKDITGDGVNIQEMNGDLFCGLMNCGIGLQMRERMDYTLTLSPDVHSYATPETLTTVIEAASKGALVVGVAIDELTQSILHGRVANTFAMWHNLSLMSVGGFDLRAASPVSDEKVASYFRGWNVDNEQPTFYARAGVEEMIPLARLFDREKRPFIAPIIPTGVGIKQYEIPTDPELLARHEAKMGTKMQRQLYMLMSEGYDFSWIKAAVMTEYRRF